ncbi:MAG: multidrug efflux SMR transporter [Wenzhouxiangellaceae bacterium]
MPWIYLTIAAVFEIGFALAMKASDGFTRPLASVVTLVGLAGGMYFLALAMKDLPVSIAYPVWVGAGALGTVIFGVLFFGEGLTPLKIVGVVAIVAGVVSLKIAGG